MSICAHAENSDICRPGKVLRRGASNQVMHSWVNAKIFELTGQITGIAFSGLERYKSFIRSSQVNILPVDI